MRRVANRIRHASSLVVAVLSRDAEVRRIRRLDANLPIPPHGSRQEFAAPRPFGQRYLPALDVALQSDRAYAGAIAHAARQLLREDGIGYVDLVDRARIGETIGVREDEWAHAVRHLQASLPGALVGLSVRRSRPSTVAFRRLNVGDEALATSNVAHVLVPAVFKVEGRVVKKFGFSTAFSLERWVPSAVEGSFASTVWNPRTSILPAEAFTVSTSSGSSPSPMGIPHLMEVTFPIDAVYTWVDGTDPSWIAHKRAALELSSGHPMPEAAAEDLRFVGHDELRYSLRALEQYAPWIRHVYIVTDCQRPEWLREDTDWVTVVDHRDIAPEGTVLPTFNSQAIEANLHRIEGLSEHFLYFNDDMFLSSPVSPDLFFHANGLASVYLSRALVGPGDPMEGEPAPDAAGKNARDLVHQVCGRRLSRKLFHAPYALRRSISFEIEECWPEVIQRTRQSQFRRLEDVTLAGGLHLNYAYATTRAVTRKIRYRYVGIGEQTAAAELEGLIRDKDSLQTFCLNDAVQEISPDAADRQVRNFLAQRFPDMGSFERLPN